MKTNVFGTYSQLHKLGFTESEPFTGGYDDYGGSLAVVRNVEIPESKTVRFSPHPGEWLDGVSAKAICT